MTNDLRIELRPGVFTHVFWKLRRTNQRFVINFGSAGSSKSWSQAQHEIIQALEKPQRIAICRKHQNWITKSVYQLVRNELLVQWGIPFEENRTERTLYLPNGSEILFIGLDDPEKIKSLENVQRVWVEEATQLTEEDLDQVNLRIRGSKDSQISLTFNPVSKDHWLKRKFFGENDFEAARGDTDAVHSTYSENPFLDDAYLEQMEWYREHDWDYFLIYGLGHWGEARTGYEFYRRFSGDNVANVEYDPTLPLHISFDFNYLPYMPASIYQVDLDAPSGYKEVRQIDEITATDPHNNTEDAAIIFANRYKDHTKKVHLYGDPSGRAQGTRTKGPSNDFDIIKRVLHDTGFQVVDRVQDGPPDISNRGDFANALFRGLEDYRILVDPKCQHSIEDFKTVKETLDGKKEKKREKDPKTGLSMEMRGHLSDSFDYFICAALRDAFNRFTKGPEVKRATGQRGKARKNRL